MAVKSAMSQQRFGYVGGKSNMKLRKKSSVVPPSSPSSSSVTDSEGDICNYQKEVRGEFSVRKLMKESVQFKVDKDHIYTYPEANGTTQSDNRMESKRTRKRKMPVNYEKSSKQKCPTKNALLAKLNRERKKEYMQTLESDNKILKEENMELNKQTEIQKKMVCQLQNEVMYLKNVLANSKELCQILKSIKNIGLPVSSSLSSLMKTEKSDNIKWEGGAEEDDRLQQLYNDNDDVQLSRTRHSSFPILYNDINLGGIVNNLQLPDLDSTFCNINAINETASDYNMQSDIKFDAGKLHFDDDSLSEIQPGDGGICLHVNNKMVSVEFCFLCNKNSALSIFSPIT